MSARWVRPEWVLWRRTLDGMVVLAPDGEALHLTAPAAALMELLAVPHTVEDSAAKLARSSGASLDDVRRDLHALLEDLAGRGVVEASR